MNYRMRGATLSKRGFLRFLVGLAAWVGAGRSGIAQAAPTGPTTDALSQSLAAALRGQPWTASEAVTLDLPQQAENGAIVPVTVASHLPDTTRILLFAANNPTPLLAQFHFEPGAEGWVSLRVKLNGSGPVLAVVESLGKFYGVEQKVQVMVGGCG